MIRLALITAVLLAGVLSGSRGAASTPQAPGAGPAVGVLVDQTSGRDARAVAAARAHVRRLRTRGVDAELRITRSPSASLAAAATLVARGAGRLVVYGAGARRILAPLEDRVAIDRPFAAG